MMTPMLLWIIVVTHVVSRKLGDDFLSKVTLQQCSLVP